MPSNKLVISPDLSLPLDAVTQTFAILGIRGSGKTNTAVVMFEEMVKHDDQCVVLDPTDAWYGVRSSSDGKSPGLQVYVFGGEHGDLPLEGNHGSQMADFVIESGASVVFSLRHLSMADQRKFAADFGERLRFLKAKPENRNPLQIFLDEAEEFVPQNIRESDPNTSRMFGAFNRIVRRDRNLGLGITLISQRPQSVNKEPLSQIETLICHRLLHKLDRKAVKESWIDGHDSAGIGEKFLDSLAALEKGDVWVWSPYWLDIFKRIHMRHRETFDSSATPKTGERQKVVKVRAQVDLDVLRQKLADTIDKARANDPTYLKRRILELEKSARDKDKAVVAAPSPADLDKAYEAGRRDLLAQVKNAKVRLETESSQVVTDFSNLTFQSMPAFADKIAKRLREVAAMLPGEAIPARIPVPEISRVTPLPRLQSVPRPTAQANGDLSGPEQKILDQLAELEALGIAEPEKPQLGLMAGYTNVRSGGFSEPMGRLVEIGYAIYSRPGYVRLTNIGREHARPVGAPLSTAELHERLCQKLGGPEAKLLREIIAIHPDEISKEDLGQRLGYTNVRSGGFSEPVGRLRSLGIIDYPRQGMVRAADWLFVA